MSITSTLSFIDSLGSPWSELIKGVLILGFLVVMFFKSFKIVDQDEKAMRMRFGRAVRKNGEVVTYGPGRPHILIPFVDKFVRVSVLDRAIDLKAIVHRHNQYDADEVVATAIYEIIDIYQVRFAVDNFEASLVAATEGSLRTALHNVGKLEDFVEFAGRVDEEYRELIEEYLEELGVKLKRLHLTNIAPFALLILGGAIREIGLPPEILSPPSGNRQVHGQPVMD